MRLLSHMLTRDRERKEKGRDKLLNVQEAHGGGR